MEPELRKCWIRWEVTLGALVIGKYWNKPDASFVQQYINDYLLLARSSAKLEGYLEGLEQGVKIKDLY